MVLNWVDGRRMVRSNNSRSVDFPDTKSFASARLVGKIEIHAYGPSWLESSFKQAECNCARCSISSSVKES